jgi:CrcB protein
MTSTEAAQDVFGGLRRALKARTLRVVMAVALGGGIGSVARYLVTTAVPVDAGSFPWATFIINVTGCFALGLLMVFVLDVWPPRRYVRPFLGIGVLGGYTTFSTVMVEILKLPSGLAWAYPLSSLFAGLAAVWCGMTLARLIARIPVRRRAREEERP